VAIRGELAGLIGVSDRPRPEAISTVAALQAMGIQVIVHDGIRSLSAL
jgi:cation transport ATPase